LKKQESNTITDSKSVVSFEYHDFLNVFFKKKVDILSSHKKHDHRIKFEKDHESDHEYISLYNLSEDELLLMKKYLKEHLNKRFIESSTASYVSSILFAKKFEEELRFCVDYRKLNAIIKKKSIFNISYSWDNNPLVESEMNDQDWYSSRFQSNSYAFKEERRLDDVSNQVRHIQIFDHALRIDQWVIDFSEFYERHTDELFKRICNRISERYHRV
jgi:hypothetical protein